MADIEMMYKLVSDSDTFPITDWLTFSRQFSPKLKYLSREITPLTKKKYTKDITGMNGVLDYTSFFGKSYYENRTLTVNFNGFYKEFNLLGITTEDLLETIRLAMASGEFFIKFSDMNTYMYKGWCTSSNITNDKEKITCTLTFEVYPFPFKQASGEEVTPYV